MPARNIGIRVEGARELRRTLRAAGEDLQDLKQAHTESARIAAAGTRLRTPVRTGRLESTVRSSGTLSAGYIRAGRASVPYANPIHWGWPARHIRAQPFATEGARATEPAWRPVFEHALNEALSRVRGI